LGLIVIDASVAVKWVLDEQDSDPAARLLRGPETLLAPELLLVEGAGAITRAFRQGRVTVARVNEAFETWVRGLEEGSVELVPNAFDLRRAAALSCDLRHPLPDCLYLALAERLGCELLTADATFARRAPAAYPNVRLFDGAAAAGA
jgi:predicted nucleic acid-binding protein